MERVVLKMRFRGDYVDVIVDDTDKCLLIDVVNDLLDEAKKHNVPLPRHPSLGYSYKMKNHVLKDDKTLMEMFSRLEGKKEIDIWIGCDTTPSHVLTLARNLRESQEGVSKDKEVVRIVADRPFKEKLQIRRPQKQFTGVPVLVAREAIPTEDVFSSLSPRRSVTLTPNESITSPEKIPSQEPNLSQTEIITSSLSPRRSLRLNQNLSIPSQSTQNPQKSQIQNSCQTQVSHNRFKMPKATAKKRGIYVPKSSPSVEVNERRSTRLSTRGKTFHMEVVDHSDSETDDSFEPSDDDDTVEDDAHMTDLEEEDHTILTSLDYIDDGYNPYENNEWVTDEDGYSAKLLENGEVYDSQDFGAIKIRPWMLFMDKEHFKDVLKEYCIQEGFYVVVVKADSKRYTAECATLNCDWRIHASVLPDGITWAIKNIRSPGHGCAGVRDHNPMATSDWVAKKLLPDIRANTSITGKSIQDLLLERYGLKMKTSTIYKMKDLALKEINGGHDESYKFLPAYCEMIKKTNPGSYAHCTWVYMDTPERLPQFKSIFISFNAQIQGVIAGCRSLIGVDGTHLKGNHGGVLLTAVALDGNNEIFPLAVSVVESENKDSWSSFFLHLKTILKDSGRDNWTVISDRQKGVEPALNNVWPEAYRRFCARHLCKNFKADYPGVLMNKLFWRVVNATSEFLFKKALELIVQHGGRGAARWLLDLGDKELWTKHMFDPIICAEDNTSNFVESFNSTLGIHRTNPVLSLLEGIRRLGMVRHATRQHIAESWDDNGVCPNILTRLKKLTKDSRGCTTFFSAPGEYEVKDGGTYLPVSLNNRTCICGLWQISGIPCKHAIRAIIDANKEPSDFVSEWFSVKRYREAYGLNISPMPDAQQWPEFDVPTLEPPTLRRSIGRPSRNRKREQGEKRKGKRSITVKCKKCNCFGHNSKTCKGGYTAKERDEMQGKIRKSRSKKGLTENSYISPYQSLRALEGDIVTSSQASQIASTSNQEVQQMGKKRKTT